MHTIHKEKTIRRLRSGRSQREKAQHQNRPNDYENKDLCQRGKRQCQWQSQAQSEQAGQIQRADRQKIVRHTVIFEGF